MTSPIQPGWTVLVVDDSELSRAVIARMLENRGFRVMTANEGAEGAVIALRELPDIVVTDLEMPVMDGYQLARLLKSDPSTEHISILILTSHRDASARFWGLETGADAFLLKDGLEEELVGAVERLLEGSTPRRPMLGGVPKTPLDVLARISRHLDSRLLEAVLINRILEGGMHAETFQDAGKAILEIVSAIVDTWFLTLAVVEPGAFTIELVLGDDVDLATSDDVVARLTTELSPEAEAMRHLEITGGVVGGRKIDIRDLSIFELPLREARAIMVLAPKEPAFEGSREQLLLDQVRPHMSLVLDNIRLAERLRELSMRDGLTRLFNRRTIHQRLCEEVERARRYSHPLSVALCDLDRFKRVNDTHGHPAGDKVLIKLAEILQQHARAPDVAGRFGGEEFLVVLPETAGSDARLAVERLRTTIEEELKITLDDGGTLAVTSSLGIASLDEIQGADEEVDPETEDTIPDELLALADKRLYAAKAAGRNQVMP
jgi:two-component system cell cycle response regulator